MDQVRKTGKSLAKRLLARPGIVVYRLDGASPKVTETAQSPIYDAIEHNSIEKIDEFYRTPSTVLSN